MQYKHYSWHCQYDSTTVQQYLRDNVTVHQFLDPIPTTGYNVLNKSDTFLEHVCSSLWQF